MRILQRIAWAMAAMVLLGLVACNPGSESPSTPPGAANTNSATSTNAAASTNTPAK